MHMKLTNISTDNNFTIGCPELSPEESPRNLVGGRISLSVVNLMGRRHRYTKREGRRERGGRGRVREIREREREGERDIITTKGV